MTSQKRGIMFERHAFVSTDTILEKELWKSTTLSTIPEHSVYVEEPIKTSTNDQTSTQTNKNSTQEAENRYSDVISMLQKANSANTSDNSCPTSKEKENDFYKPNFKCITNKGDQYC